jgi:enamidase
MRELAKDRDGLGRPTATAYFSGPALTAPGGYPGPLHGRDFGLEVRGEAEAARAVERLAGLGARVVKVALEPGPQGRWPMPGPGELAAAVREARLLGLPVHAHVEDLAALPLAVEAGVDVVEHLPCRATDAAGPRPLFSGDPADPELPAEYEELLSRMAGRGVAATPTLSAAARATWNDAGINKAVRRFVALGGQVAAGSDAPYRGVEPGLPLGEYELLLRAGLTPAQVLEAATRVAAKVCGRARELGTVEPGRIADLIVLAGNPLDDIANLRRLALVIKDGAVAHAAALD